MYLLKRKEPFHFIGVSNPLVKDLCMLLQERLEIHHVWDLSVVCTCDTKKAVIFIPAWDATIAIFRITLCPYHALSF